MRRFCSLLLALVVLVFELAGAMPVEGDKIIAQTHSGLEAGSGRLAPAKPAVIAHGLADYGPFRVLSEFRAALIGVTDDQSPRAFAAMLRDHPHIVLLDMISCPGTEDDLANLQVGLMIHAHGIATHVPDGGSVRSGAVDLFVAGVRRLADPGAAFAVHAWKDTAGLQPRDYPADAPKNREYIDYYKAVGMTSQEAEAFYAMTNSVPFDNVRWLKAAELGRWVRLDKSAGDDGV
jgi:hypothetical protein